MRYYLDTNILIFILLKQRDEINSDILELLADYSNTFYISTVVIRELILLHKEGKMDKSKYKTYRDFFNIIDELNYIIVPVTKPHLYAYAELSPFPDHKDPNDHIIIAQAISDKIPIISSDKKFKLYEKQGLQFVFNKR